VYEWVLAARPRVCAVGCVDDKWNRKETETASVYRLSVVSVVEAIDVLVSVC
jgi:hypothetical protein